MSRRSNTLILATVAVVVASGVVVVGHPSLALAGSCAGGVASDFNGDGIADAAIADRTESTDLGGAVHVLYGTRSGLVTSPVGTAPDDQRLVLPHSASANFELQLLAVDLNVDGCSDLVVAEPSATVAGVRYVGRVREYYGSPTGLHDSGIAFDEQDITGTAPEESDQFGSSLAVGEFNGDDLPDLVIGEPPGNMRAGSVFILPGQTTFQPRAGRQFHQGDGIIPGTPSPGWTFGLALAVADFDRDGHSDVAIGVPGDNTSGEVAVVRGSGTASMLTATGARLWNEATTAVPGPVGHDEYGWTLAVGSLRGNGLPDLAVGAPGRTVSGHTSAGIVNVVLNSGNGLSPTGNQVWSQDSTGIPGSVEDSDYFGQTLAAGDFNGDGHSDLAVGEPFETVDGNVSAGAVNVILGGSAGLQASGATLWDQATAGIYGKPESGDQFGFSLATVSTTAAGRSDLLIGIPWEAVDGDDNDGLVEFLPGSPAGPTATGAQAWDDESPGLAGGVCQDCAFGFSLA